MKRITSQDRIEEIFSTADLSTCETLLAVARAMMKVRFGETPKAQRKKRAPVIVKGETA